MCSLYVSKRTQLTKSPFFCLLTKSLVKFVLSADFFFVWSRFVCQLTKSLVTFKNEDDLTSKIDDIYARLDEDESGGLTFREFRMGLKQFSSHIHITREDFDIVTENGKHLGATNEFNREQFQTMMKKELWRYSRRELANVLSVKGDEQFNSTILMLKMMESEVLQLLHSIEHHVTADPYGQRQSAVTGHPSLPRSKSGGTGGGGLGGEGGDVLRWEVDWQSSKMDRMSSMMEQILEKIDRQSSNMEHMSAKMDRHSVVLERHSVLLEDQMAAIMRMQATKANSPLPMKFESRGRRVGKNETDPGFLAEPSSTLLEQVSDRVTPSQQRKQVPNDMVLLQSCQKSGRALQARGRRNEESQEGEDRLPESSPSARYMEHVHLVDKVTQVLVADESFAPVSAAREASPSSSAASPLEREASLSSSSSLERREVQAAAGRAEKELPHIPQAGQEATLRCDVEARHAEAYLKSQCPSTNATYYRGKRDLRHVEAHLTHPRLTVQRESSRHVASNEIKTAEDMIKVAEFYRERRLSFVEACYYSEPADSSLDMSRIHNPYYQSAQ